MYISKQQSQLFLGEEATAKEKTVKTMQQTSNTNKYLFTVTLRNLTNFLITFGRTA